MSELDQIVCFTLACAVAAFGSDKFSGCSGPEMPRLFPRLFLGARPVYLQLSLTSNL